LLDSLQLSKADGDSGRLSGTVSEPSDWERDEPSAVTVILFSGLAGKLQIGHYDKPLDLLTVFL
jgi:hypothetical protein